MKAKRLPNPTVVIFVRDVPMMTECYKTLASTEGSVIQVRESA
jgi:hypothetical protein